LIPHEVGGETGSTVVVKHLPQLVKLIFALFKNNFALILYSCNNNYQLCIQMTRNEKEDESQTEMKVKMNANALIVDFIHNELQHMK
jgi:hypothetical protein